MNFYFETAIKGDNKKCDNSIIRVFIGFAIVFVTDNAQVS
jgi:hypothetical protein